MRNNQEPLSVELETKEKYRGKIYRPDRITLMSDANSNNYFDVLLNIKLDLVKQIVTEETVLLDLCCATGLHLLNFSDTIKNGIGIDFSKHFIEKANCDKELAGIDNIQFLEANARNIPLGSNSVDVAYCFSSLYTIPDVAEVISEVSRVLTEQGRCVLDMGNRYSLNTLVCNAYPELAKPCHISVHEMKQVIYDAGLEIVTHKAFQVLPLWGGRPTWLRGLLHPNWIKIMQKQVYGKMIDEWISSFFLIKRIAFRHIIVCQKSLKK